MIGLSFGSVHVSRLVLIACLVCAVICLFRSMHRKKTSWISMGICAVLIAGFVSLFLLQAPPPTSQEKTSVEINVDANAPSVVSLRREGSVTADALSLAPQGDPGESSSMPEAIRQRWSGLHSWSKGAIAAGALAFLLVLTYLFLDAGRRGRYTWPLRLGTAIVFAGLCVLLWKIGPLM